MHIHQKFQESATKRSRDMSIFVKSFQKSVNRIRIAFSREKKCFDRHCHGCVGTKIDGQTYWWDHKKKKKKKMKKNEK